MPDKLRVLDFGPVSPLRSQSIWHALAEAAGETGRATLSFMRPAAPYVGIGMQRSIAEVDLDYCRSAGLSVIRRRVGGGPVYLDARQLFFQVSMPRRSLPASRGEAISGLLGPLAPAFAAAGIDASLDGSGELSASGAKVCGHGAGEIGDGVAVVGNLITAFNYTRAAGICWTGSARVTERLEALMRRWVGSFPHDLDASAFMAAAPVALAEALGMVAEAGELDSREQQLIRAWDNQLSDPAWTREGEFPPPAPGALRVVKIRSGVHAIFRTTSGPGFFATAEWGRLSGLEPLGEECPPAVEGEEVHAALAALAGAGWLDDSELRAISRAGVMESEGVRA
ncbi:MAG: hypothetical protein M0Z92_05255 [Actinomycetota bacterium]|nr:hypothetical protein [Actinomycetota bacterium]